MVQQQCPSNSTLSFPITISNTLTPDYTNTPVTALNYEITWGSGTEIPEFSQAASNQSGELYHSSFNSTRLLDSATGATYFLNSIQITRDLHKKWLLKSSAINEEDIILTFISEEKGDDTSQYIILVNPVIRISAPVVSSTFLESFANQTTNTISPSSLFPNVSGNKYAYYKSCAKGITVDNRYQYATVVINRSGIEVWANFMNQIKSKFQNLHGAATPYPSYRAIYYQLFSESPTVISSQVEFNRIVNISNGYYTGPSRAGTVTQVVTDAYKCVPLNPETDISGGAFRIDPTTGLPLSNTLNKRKAEIDNYNASYTATVSYELIKEHVNTFLIVLLSIAFIAAIIYAIQFWTKGEAEYGTGPSFINLAFKLILQTPIYVVIAFVCTFIGILVGVYSKPSSHLGRPSGSPSG